MTFQLRDRILAWSIASTLVIVLAVLFLVDSVFRTTIRSTMEENLLSGARLAYELRGSRVEDWIVDVGRLALEPTLRAAVETGDPPTIRQILEGVRTSSGADWIAVATPEGDLLAAAGPTPVARVSSADRLFDETLYFDSGDLWRDSTGLVDVGASSVFFGDLRLGILVGGRRVGPERAEELSTFTGQEVAFLAGDRVTAGDPGVEPEVADELLGLAGVQQAPAVGGLPAGDAVAAPMEELRLAGETYLGTALPLADADRRTVGHLAVFRSLDAALAPARQLRLALLGIGSAGLLLGLVFSVALTRSVTSPLSTLLAETVRLGSGNLEQPIGVMRRDEIGQLAEGFEKMRVSLREAREEVIRRERLSAVGRAASSLVHDFTQPITVIQSHTELLVHDWADPEARAEDLGAIRAGVHRLQTMMREILEFARGEARIEPAPGSVPALLEDVAGQVRPALAPRGIALEVGHGYQGEWVLDHQRTARALTNLVRNAASALDRGGGTIQLRSFRLNGRLRLEVEDDGPGIPAEIRDTLFEPFVSRGKREGTGLGLAIVKNIAEGQGATVTFESTADGTVFVLDFPEVE